MEPQHNTFQQSPQIKNEKKSKNKLFLFSALAAVLLITFAVNTMSGAPSAQGNDTSNTEISDAKESQPINKTYSFPLRDEKGKEVSKIKYTIENAELRDEIIVRGQRATSIDGRTFLIINLKITNDFDQSVQMNVKDYLRLTRNDSQEKLAADIHNDPVEVQAISTKYTRVAFPINTSDKNLVLHVGEIEGDKETLKITLTP